MGEGLLSVQRMSHSTGTVSQSGPDSSFCHGTEQISIVDRCHCFSPERKASLRIGLAPCDPNEDKERC